MRLGLHVSTDRPIATQVVAAEAHGFDLVWLDEARDPKAAAPLVEASFVASVAPSIRVVAALAAGAHPVSMAEEAAVADLALGGRLTVALRSGQGGRAQLDETVAVLRSAWTARPFRHEGEHWRVPANLPENEGWVERRIRVTPTPAQIQLPLWLVGTGVVEVAADHGLPLVSDAEPLDAVAAAWNLMEERLRRVAEHLPRPAIWEVAAAGRSDVDQLSRDLVTARDRFGLDVAVLRLPAGLDDATWDAALATIAHEVRPRVQLDSLPPGTEEFWTDQRTEQIERTS
jgi:alkanesulfonate monooxygenase SsuD/methylene tetrahydromethanopterin reductase-like flavin-dependent oxidoreductase (luciferase family)